MHDVHTRLVSGVFERGRRHTRDQLLFAHINLVGTQTDYKQEIQD
jgi:hypothetical protein